MGVKELKVCAARTLAIHDNDVVVDMDTLGAGTCDKSDRIHCTVLILWLNLTSNWINCESIGADCRNLPGMIWSILLEIFPCVWIVST